MGESNSAQTDNGIKLGIDHEHGKETTAADDFLRWLDLDTPEKIETCPLPKGYFPQRNSYENVCEEINSNADKYQQLQTIVEYFFDKEDLVQVKGELRGIIVQADIPIMQAKLEDRGRLYPTNSRFESLLKNRLESADFEKEPEKKLLRDLAFSFSDDDLYFENIDRESWAYIVYFAQHQENLSLFHQSQAEPGEWETPVEALKRHLVPDLSLLRQLVDVPDLHSSERRLFSFTTTMNDFMSRLSDLELAQLDINSETDCKLLAQSDFHTLSRAAEQIRSHKMTEAQSQVLGIMLAMASDRESMSPESLQESLESISSLLPSTQSENGNGQNLLSQLWTEKTISLLSNDLLRDFLYSQANDIEKRLLSDLSVITTNDVLHQLAKSHPYDEIMLAVQGGQLDSIIAEARIIAITTPVNFSIDHQRSIYEAELPHVTAVDIRRLAQRQFLLPLISQVKDSSVENNLSTLRRLIGTMQGRAEDKQTLFFARLAFEVIPVVDQQNLVEAQGLAKNLEDDVGEMWIRAIVHNYFSFSTPELMEKYLRWLEKEDAKEAEKLVPEMMALMSVYPENIRRNVDFFREENRQENRTRYNDQNYAQYGSLPIEKLRKIVENLTAYYRIEPFDDPDYRNFFAGQDEMRYMKSIPQVASQLQHCIDLRRGIKAPSLNPRP